MNISLVGASLVQSLRATLAAHVALAKSSVPAVLLAEAKRVPPQADLLGGCRPTDDGHAARAAVGQGDVYRGSGASPHQGGSRLGPPPTSLT